MREAANIRASEAALRPGQESGKGLHRGNMRALPPEFLKILKENEESQQGYGGDPSSASNHNSRYFSSLPVHTDAHL